jgi:N-acyl-D-aspartate/D-glutamate deacylase
MAISPVPTAPRSLRLALCLMVMVTALKAASAAPEPADVVIRGGTLHDGSAGAPYVGDVAIKGDRIVYVGSGAPMTAARTIDASGMIVTPGFIDPHTHADGFLRAPDAATRVNAAWLYQGVTSVMIGVDGSGTPDVGDDARKLTASGVGTNIVPFVGFGAVRQRVLGQAARAPDAADLARMQRLVAKAMCEGATGLSTGLFYAPQSFARPEEVIAVAREAAKRGGMYDTHQRDESSYSIGLLGSVREVLTIGREAGMPVHFAHIKALGVDLQGQAQAVINLIEAARAAGQAVTADQYPWLASGTSIDAALLPRWAVDGGDAALLQRLDDPAMLARIRADMAENMRRRGGAASLLLISEGFEWTGKTLENLAQVWKVDPRDAALRILRDSIAGRAAGRQGRGTGVASFNMAQADVDLLMQQPWVVTSSDGSDGHPRMFASFPEKYRRYVKERPVITRTDFIHRSTGRTADIYKLAGRGYLRTGYYADVAVIDPEKFMPRADYLKPRELSDGVTHLFVNGTAALADGKATGTLPGRVLLRPTPAECP